MAHQNQKLFHERDHAAEMELRRIVSRVKNGITGPVAWVAIVPLRRSRDHVPTDPIAVKDALEELEALGMTDLVVDLRGNGGGLFDSTLYRFAKRGRHADFAMARDRDLAGRQQPFPHLALRPVEHRFHFRRIKTDLGRTACVKFSL